MSDGFDDGVNVVAANVGLNIVTFLESAEKMSTYLDVLNLQLKELSNVKVGSMSIGNLSRDLENINRMALAEAESQNKITLARERGAVDQERILSQMINSEQESATRIESILSQRTGNEELNATRIAAVREQSNATIDRINAARIATEETTNARLEMANTQRIALEETTGARIAQIDTNTQLTQARIATEGIRQRRMIDQESTASSQTYFDKMTTSLKHHLGMMASMASMAVMYGGFDLFKEGIVDFEKNLAGVEQVLEETYKKMGTELSPEMMAKIGESFSVIAERWGQSVQEVLQGAKDWGRQYKDLNTIQELVNSTTLLSVVDNLSLGESVKGLEATMNQYGMVARNAGEAQEYSMRIVDSWSAVAHKSMISALDLAQGNEKAASSARMVGIDFDNLQGLIAAGVRATGRSGNELGNTLKTMFASLHSADAIKELHELGVEVKDMAGNFRPAQQVFADLMIAMAGTKYNMEEVVKSVSSGKFQWSKAAAILGDYDTYIKATAQSINSAGLAQQYMAVQMDTVSRKAGQLHQALIALTVSAGNSGLTGALKAIIDDLRYFVDGLNNGGMKAVALGLAVVGVASIINKLRLATLAAGEAQVAFNLQLAVGNALMGNIVGLTAAAAVLAVGAYTIGLGKSADAQTELIEKQKQAVEQHKQMSDQYGREIDFMSQLEEQHNKLSVASKNSSNTDEQKASVNKSLEATEESLAITIGDSSATKIKDAGYTHDAFQSVVKSLQGKQDAEKVAWQNSSKMVSDATNNLRQNITTQIEQIGKVAEAYGIMGTLQENGLWLEKKAVYARYELNPTPDNAKAYDDMEKRVSGFYASQRSNKFADLISQLNSLGGSGSNSSVPDIPSGSGFNEIPFGGDDSKKAKTKKEAASSLSEQVSIEESLIRSFNTQVKQTEQADKLLQKQIDQAKKQKEYNEEISLTNQLLAGQQTELAQLAEAKSKIESEFAKVSSNFADSSTWVDANGEATLTYQEQWNASSVETQKQMTKTFDELSKLQKAWTDNGTAVDTLNNSIDNTKDSFKAIAEELKTFGETLGKQDASDLVKPYEDAYAEIKKLPSLLSATDNNADKQKAIEYSQQISNVLIQEVNKISDRIANIPVLLSMQTDPTTITKLKTELSELTAKKYQVQIDIISNIKQQVENINNLDVSKLKSNFTQLKIDGIANINQIAQSSTIFNPTATNQIAQSTANWNTALAKVQETMKQIGTPTTLAGQVEYNSLLTDMASKVKSAQKAWEDYLKAVDKAKFDAMMENIGGPLEEITKMISVVDGQMQTVANGTNSSLQSINYDMPQIKYNTPEQAAALAQAPEVEFQPPTTFVNYINDDFQKAIDSANANVKSLQDQIDALGASPENQDQVVSLFTQMGAEAQKVNDKVSVILAGLTDPDQIAAVKSAYSSVMEIPVVEMQTQAQNGIDEIQKGIINSGSNVSIPVVAETDKAKLAIKAVEDGDYQTVLTVNAETTNAQQAITSLEKPTSSIHTVYVQTVTSATVNAKGTDSHPGGPAIFGEKGRELVEFPDGTAFVSGDKAEIADLPKGTKILPSKETEEFLHDQGVPGYATGTGVNAGDSLKTVKEKQGAANDKEMAAHAGQSGSAEVRNGVSNFTANDHSTNTANVTNNVALTTTVPALDLLKQYGITDMSQLNNMSSSQLLTVKQGLIKQGLTTANTAMAGYRAQLDPYKNADGTYRQDASPIVDKMNALISTEQGLQQQLNASIAQQYELEYQSYDKAKSNSEWSIKNAQSQLEYSKLIGSSKEDIIAKEEDILAKQKRELASQIEAQSSLKKEATDGVNSGKFAYDSLEYNTILTKYESVTDTVNELNTAVYNTIQEVASLNLEKLTTPFTDAQANLETEISLNEKLIKLEQLQGETQGEISTTVKRNIIDQQAKLVSQEAELPILEANLASQKEGTDEWKNAKAAVDALKGSILDTKTAITQVYSDVADQIIAAYKAAYKEQEDIALASISTQEKAYNDLIDAKVKALSDTGSLTDYNEQLAKDQADAQKTQDKIDDYSLDTSADGKAKKLELAQTLADQQTAIADKMRHHDVDLQTQSLNDQKTNNSKAVETQKQITTNYYDSLINDDAKYADIRQQIYAGNFTDINKDFADFNATFSAINAKTISDLGLSFQSVLNLIKQVTDATTAASGLGTGGLGNALITPVVPPTKTPDVTTPPPSTTTPTTPTTVNDPNSPHFDIASGKVVNLTKDMIDQITQDELNGRVKDPNGAISLEEVIAKFNLPRFKEGGETQRTGLHWLDGKSGEPERILSSEQTSAWNMLSRDIVPVASILSSALKTFNAPNFTPGSQGAAVNSGGLHLEFHIANLNGGKEGAKEMISIVANTCKKRGRW